MTSTNQSSSESSLKSIGSNISNPPMIEDMVKKVIIDMMSDGVVSSSTSSTPSSLDSAVQAGVRRGRSTSTRSSKSSCEGKKKKKKKKKKQSTRKKKEKSKSKRRGRSRSPIPNERMTTKNGSNQHNNSNSESWESMITEWEHEEGGKETMSSEALKLRIEEGKTHRRSRGESAASTRTSRSSRISLHSSFNSKRSSTEVSLESLKLRIEEATNDLNNLLLEEKEQRQQQNNNNSSISNELLDDDYSDSESVSTVKTIGSTRSTRSKPGSREFNQEMVSKLHIHRKSLCIQDDEYTDNTHSNNNNGDEVVKSEVDDFVAAFDPNDMRCLALVSHNEMKTTMKNFVIKYKNVLKKFKLTGTNSTMKMLGQVFEGDASVVFGPACSSGPLGGDAELVAMMAQGQLGGILFFQDPMTSHPHQCDIECLVRQALVHNTVIATTPITAMTIMEVFKLALMGNGRPELLPSFFFSLQSPTVESYKKGQAKVIENRTS